MLHQKLTCYALHNYPQGSRNSDVFANLVSKTDDDKSAKENEKTPKSYPNSAFYSEESLVGYRWFDTKKVPVKYSFGYGLTYTTFEYGNLKTDKQKYGRNDVIRVSLNLKNTGKMPADEVAQVYIHRINPSVEWPEKELKAFSRVSLKPGEARSVQLEIPVKDLMFWNEKKHMWDNDLCKIEIMAGASAGDIKLRQEVVLK